LFTSLYAIITLNAINKIKNKKCVIASPIGEIIFFQNNFSIIQFRKINKNLHQSRAGIGSKLKIQRFIEIIAQKTTRNIIQDLRDSLINPTIQIGQLTDFSASSLSSLFSGLNIFPAK
jgi:hypothetical protein